MEELATVAAVWCSLTGGSRQVGLAVLRTRPRSSREDKAARELVLYQFLDTDRWANVESLLVAAAPAHVYIADGLPPAEAKKVTGVAGEAAPDVTVEVVSKSLFAEAEVGAALTKLAGRPLLELDSARTAAKAAACLVAKGNLAAEAALHGAYAVTLAAHDRFVRLDSAALRALNLFSSARDAAVAAMSASAAAVASGAASAEEGAGAGAGASAGAAAASPGAAATTPTKSARRTAASTNVTSLHALLSYGCKTRGGARVLRQWILQPLRDVGAINARLDVVEAFVRSPQLRRSWREGLNVSDLDALGMKLQRKNATLVDILRLYQFALQLPSLAEKLRAEEVDEESGGASARRGGSAAMALDDDAAAGSGGGAGADADGDTAMSGAGAGGGSRSPLARFLQKLTWAGREFAKFISMCEEIIEDVTATEPRIKPSWDEALRKIVGERDELEAEVEELFAKAQSTWGKTLDGELKCERDKIRGFVYRTRRSSEKALRAVPTASITQVLKDGIYFTTTGPSGLKAVSDRLLEVEREYETQSRSIVAEAIEIARSYIPVLEAAATVVSELDAFCSLAHLATSAPGTYVRPTLLASDAGGGFALRAARHPVMEMQESVTFIPNDYAMDRETSRFQIITGPNMGGKSTYCRTLGVVALMAQLGSYVPAEEAVVPVLDCICARIGAGDKAVKGVSTFMAEMMEASTILATATPASLVIIDELGRGTSTYDGFGLAWAISEHLVQRTRCFTLFATHFHELTALAAELPGVVNRHVSAQTTAESITMLYAVKEGPCPASFGIHVAELAAFPASVIAIARAKAAELERTSAVGSGGSGSAAALAGKAPAAAASATAKAVSPAARALAVALVAEADALRAMGVEARKARLAELRVAAGLTGSSVDGAGAGAGAGTGARRGGAGTDDDDL